VTPFVRPLAMVTRVSNFSRSPSSEYVTVLVAVV
jgi:hypothetical protein